MSRNEEYLKNILNENKKLRNKNNFNFNNSEIKSLNNSLTKNKMNNYFKQLTRDKSESNKNENKIRYFEGNNFESNYNNSFEPLQKNLKDKIKWTSPKKS